MADARLPTITLSSGRVLMPIMPSGVATCAIDDQMNMAMPAAMPASRVRMMSPKNAAALILAQRATKAAKRDCAMRKLG